MHLFRRPARYERARHLWSGASWPSCGPAVQRFQSRPACAAGAQTGRSRHRTREAYANGAADARQRLQSPVAGSPSASSPVTKAAMRSARRARRARRCCSICGRSRVIARRVREDHVTCATSVSEIHLRHPDAAPIEIDAEKGRTAPPTPSEGRVRPPSGAAPSGRCRLGPVQSRAAGAKLRKRHQMGTECLQGWRMAGRTT